MTKATIFGFNPPFIGGPEKVMSRQEDDKIIKNDLLQLLMTVPGERVHRPEYGVGLRNFVFEQLTTSDLDILRSEIIEKISIYEPRVNILSLKLIPDEENNGVVVELIFSLVSDPATRIDIVKFFAGASNG